MADLAFRLTVVAHDFITGVIAVTVTITYVRRMYAFTTLTVEHRVGTVRNYV